MKPRFGLFGSGQRKNWAGIGLIMGAVWFFAASIFAQSYVPGMLLVEFKPGAVNPPFQRGADGKVLTGISYIDDINEANNYRNLFMAGEPGLPSTANWYFVLFPDTADLLAIADAYLANPNVVAASPDYWVNLNYTPDDSLFYRAYETPPIALRCRQWAFDSAHCQFEKAWDITLKTLREIEGRGTAT